MYLNYFCSNAILICGTQDYCVVPTIGTKYKILVEPAWSPSNPKYTLYCRSRQSLARVAAIGLPSLSIHRLPDPVYGRLHQLAEWFWCRIHGGVDGWHWGLAVDHTAT